MKHLTFAVAGVLTFLAGCAPLRPPRPPKTQLEIRQIQTREYETRDMKLVMKALVNVLQDDGFIIRNAVVDLGLVTATKELEVRPVASSGGMLGGLFFGGGGYPGGYGGGWGAPAPSKPITVNSIIEASANVSEFGKLVRVRVNFQKKTVDNRGGTVDVRQLEDARFYQDFFSKVDKGIYLQREKL